MSKLLVKYTDGVYTKYVYGNGLIGEETNVQFKTYHFDYRGSTIAITDSQGNVTDRFKYNTYGKVTEHTGSSNVIFKYNGRDGVITEPNGLYYMRARYYSPDLMRFINADILTGSISNSPTLNRYAYANGNPVSNIDPFGLSAERGNSLPEGFFEWMEGIGYSIIDIEATKIKLFIEAYYYLSYVNPSTYLHFELRGWLNGSMPTFEEANSKDSGWTKVPENQTVYHDNGDEYPEYKFTHKDGREAVFDGKTHELIIDYDYIGTFNYCPIRQLPEKPNLLDHIANAVTTIGHGILDVAPYYTTILSNSREHFKSKSDSVSESYRSIARKNLDELMTFMENML